MKLDTAINKAFDKANLIGETVDLDGILLSYKAIRDVYYNDPDKYEEIYKQVSKGLFSSYK